jgi:hypothetical protein
MLRARGRKVNGVKALALGFPTTRRVREPARRMREVLRDQETPPALEFYSSKHKVAENKKTRQGASQPNHLADEPALCAHAPNT